MRLFTCAETSRCSEDRGRPFRLIRDTGLKPCAMCGRAFSPCRNQETAEDNTTAPNSLRSVTQPCLVTSIRSGMGLPSAVSATLRLQPFCVRLRFPFAHCHPERGTSRGISINTKTAGLSFRFVQGCDSLFCRSLLKVKFILRVSIAISRDLSTRYLAQDDNEGGVRLLRKQTSTLAIHGNPTHGTFCARICLVLSLLLSPFFASAVDFEQEIMPLLKKRCTECHSPLKAKGELTLSSPRYIARGGENGAVVIPGNLEKSRLWELVSSDEMPEKEPLTKEEKSLLREWITEGAGGLPAHVEGDDTPIEHWAFAPLSSPDKKSIDHYISARLAKKGLKLSPQADRRTLIRRVAFDLTGLLPTLEEIRTFLNDKNPDAYARMVERYLASKHYGERWGKFWLDVAGYADSDGYFIDFDQERPLAYLYRDYVIRAFNENKPFDQFVREQLAGDELSGYRPGTELSPKQVDMLVATHFLRNSEDGTDRNMGTPEERITTRYATLEGTMQIVGSSLMGLTVKCAQCHDHKFEPITQREYYEFQSILYPAFDIENWVTPKNRWVDTAAPKVLDAWKNQVENAEDRLVTQHDAFSKWEKQTRPHGEVLWKADFASGTDGLRREWSANPPKADAPKVGFSETGKIKAYVKGGILKMEDAKPSRFTWITSRQKFDWTPALPGEWVQMTFDLVDGSGSTKGKLARFGFLIATLNGDGGNVLIDSSPAYGIDVITNSLKKGGMRGQTGPRFRGYFPGDNYGVRVTNIGDGNFEIEHVLNGLPEEKKPSRPRVVRSMVVKADQLPDGGIGFAYRGEGFHYSVDNILVERSTPDQSSEALQSARKKLNSARSIELSKAETIEVEIKELQGDRPGKVAWVTDRSDKAADVFMLNRGSYFSKGEKVSPNVFSFLTGEASNFDLTTAAKEQQGQSTGRRLAFARWITQPGSRASALMARVTMNRMWQRHFGTGIVASTENLGYSGATASHPDLLEFLASKFIASGWDTKAMHRKIVMSAVYRQSSAESDPGQKTDPANRLLWRAPVRRLDAEAIRDAMLLVSGQLDQKMGGPYVPTKKLGSGEVVMEENNGKPQRRSVYLQYRRSQEHTMLQTFDAPKMVVNCVRRNLTTVPLQSLSLMNSSFILDRAESMAERLSKKADGIDLAFQLAWGRSPTAEERKAATLFLAEQPKRYQSSEAGNWAWRDFCQSLLAANGFLYVE